MKSARGKANAKAGKQPKAIESLRDLTPDPKNARRHTPRNVGAIVDALQAVGAARSIVIDERGVVLAGNATIEAAAEAGINRVQVVDVDGETIVAVRRVGLSAKQKTRLALADNRAAELAEWDEGVLAALRAEDASLLGGLWTDDELAILLREVSKGGLTDPDDVPAVRATDIRPGMVFSLGAHRLMCGSSTEAQAVEVLLAGAKPGLMVTDPPYGVEYDPSWREGAGLGATKRTGKVTNDDIIDW